MHRGLWTLAGLLVVSSACAHGRPAASAAAPRPDSLTVHVTNHFTRQLWIVARGVNQEYLVGTVEPGADTQFVLGIPWLYGQPVEFVARGTASPPGQELERRMGRLETVDARPAARSGQFELHPGDILDFVIEGNLMHSRASLRP